MNVPLVICAINTTVGFFILTDCKHSTLSTGVTIAETRWDQFAVKERGRRPDGDKSGVNSNRIEPLMWKRPGVCSERFTPVLDEAI